MNTNKYLLATLILGVALLGIIQLQLWFHEQKIEETDGMAHITSSAPTAITSYFASPLPAPVIDNPAAVTAGEMLFADSRLSKDKNKSCTDCHQFNKAGTDHTQYSPTIGGGYRTRNTPTIFNLAFVNTFNWDGSVNNLEDQIEGIIKSSQGLGADWETILPRLAESEEYTRLFNAISPEGITRENVIEALAEYERSLVTIDSPFDLFLNGNFKAISAEAKQGIKLFVELGCSSCHQGLKLGDNLFSKFGVFGDYFKDRGSITAADYGRFNVTSKEEDRYVFRVPGLRNIAKTYPYFHDGTIQDLDRAMNIMAHYQLGRTLPAEEISHLRAFMESLTGNYRGKSL
jgi:cytochrome c peroxidase